MSELEEILQALELAQAIAQGNSVLQQLVNRAETVEWLSPTAVEAIAVIGSASAELILELMEASEGGERVNVLEGLDASQLPELGGGALR